MCIRDRVLHDVNIHLSNRVTNGRFVTASLLTIKDDELSYASAGHQPLIIYHTDSDEFEDINADGIAMGIIDQMDFERVMPRMFPGDIAVMFTDGLNEAMNRSRKEFGYENMKKVISLNRERTAKEIVEALFCAVRNHISGAEMFDDTTVVAIKRIGGHEKDMKND